MTSILELTKRLLTLEDALGHLATHHDELFADVKDDTNASDRCERLFNIDINRGAHRPAHAPLNQRTVEEPKRPHATERK